MILPDEYTSFNDFVNSLHNDFNTRDIIPLDAKEENWKDWGNTVSSSNTFISAGCPRTDSFTDWREWGKMLYSRFG